MSESGFSFSQAEYINYCIYIATGKAVSQYCLFQLRIRTAVLKYGV